MDPGIRFCPYCGERLHGQALRCSHCGKYLAIHFRERMSTTPGFYWGFEYRSPQMIFSMPLIHVAQGFDPETGLPRVTRGFIAIGGFAVGVISIGGFAVGGFVFSGIGLGLIAIGGIAMGGLALGGIALGLVFAVGGIAVSMGYAFGALPIKPIFDWGLGSMSLLREFVARLVR